MEAGRRRFSSSTPTPSTGPKDHAARLRCSRDSYRRRALVTATVAAKRSDSGQQLRAGALIDAHVIDQHALWKLGGVVGRPWPVAPDRDIQQDEKGMVVNPLCS